MVLCYDFLARLLLVTILGQARLDCARKLLALLLARVFAFLFERWIHGKAAAGHRREKKFLFYRNLASFRVKISSSSVHISDLHCPSGDR